MEKKEYFELLKDPRWQKKRLEIFDRDKFSCRVCGNKNEMLSVHHKVYVFNTPPWEYDNDKLLTVCDICHKTLRDIEKKYLPKITAIIKNMFYGGGLMHFHDLMVLLQVKYNKTADPVFHMWKGLKKRNNLKRTDMSKEVFNIKYGQNTDTTRTSLDKSGRSASVY